MLSELPAVSEWDLVRFVKTLNTHNCMKIRALRRLEFATTKISDPIAIDNTASNDTLKRDDCT